MRAASAFSPWVESFGELMIASHIAGFSVAKYPLWELGCLLNENWLEEDLLNSLLELLYFQNAAQLGEASPLFLPTSFFNDAKHLSSQSHHEYSPNMVALRDRLFIATPPAISTVSCIDGHFSGYYINSNGHLEHGDSMGFSADPEVLPIFQWILAGLDAKFTVPHVVAKGGISRQGPGSGSCGIATYNYLELCTSSNTASWSDQASPLFRDDALSKLLAYHFTAINKGVSLFRLPSHSQFSHVYL